MIFHIQNIKDIFDTFKSDINGLSESEVESRILIHGKNSLPQKRKKGILEIFILQFKSPIIYILLIAAIVSFSIGEFNDAYFILGVLLINAIIGAYQEHSANEQADGLKQIIKTFVTVLRDGEKQEVVSEEITIGDIVFLESGTKIPADIRLIQDNNLKVNESLLTGESTDILKDSNFKTDDLELSLGDRKNMLYAGSFVSSGRGNGVVVAIGVNTEIGRIASLLASSQEGEVPLIKKMEKFSLDIAKIIAIVVILLFIIGYIQGIGVKELFFLAVALSVSALPEGLPVAITVALTSASIAMSKKSVIVRKLAAIEGLGSCTFIASDKTGTLTKNILTVEKFISSDGEVFDKNKRLSEEIYECAILCNEVNLKLNGEEVEFSGDQVDIALAKFAIEADKKYLNLNYEKIDDTPYESQNRYSSVTYKIDGKNCHFLKGSPETILKYSNISKDEEAKILKEINEFAGNGYRNIAMAIKFDDKKLNLKDFKFLGFVAIIDPIRDEAKEAVFQAKEAGIEVAMVTGDHPNTAYSIANELGIATSKDEVINGEELLRWQEREGDLSEIANKRVFARVSPEQKQLIVTSLQELGHFVAVTGDGVNDAVALKYSNIGIAMGKNGTDVARESSDLILTDDNFKSIINGIKEGRVAYDNIRKVIYLLISTGFAEVVLIILAMLFMLPIPLLPVQLLWLNLVTNGIQHIGLGLQEAEPDILKRKPRSPKEKIFNYIMIRRVLIGGLYMGIVAFLVFLTLLNMGYSTDMARNVTLLLMVLFENVHVFNSSSEKNPIYKINYLNNKLIISSVILTQFIHIISMQIPFMQNLLSIEPVSLDMWFILLGLSLVLVAVMEVDKRFMKRKLAI